LRVQSNLVASWWVHFLGFFFSRVSGIWSSQSKYALLWWSINCRSGVQTGWAKNTTSAVGVVSSPRFSPTTQPNEWLSSSCGPPPTPYARPAFGSLLLSSFCPAPHSLHTLPLPPSFLMLGFLTRSTRRAMQGALAPKPAQAGEEEGASSSSSGGEEYSFSGAGSDGPPSSTFVSSHFRMDPAALYQYLQRKKISFKVRTTCACVCVSVRVSVRACACGSQLLCLFVSLSSLSLCLCVNVSLSSFLLSVQEDQDKLNLRFCPSCPDHKGRSDNMYKLFIWKTTGSFFCHRCATKGCVCVCLCVCLSPLPPALCMPLSCC